MLKLTISCGCGIRTSSVREAQEHCEQTGHIMHLSGSIEPSASPSAIRQFNRMKEDLVTERLAEALWAEAEDDPDLVDLVPDSRRARRRP